MVGVCVAVGVGVFVAVGVGVFVAVGVSVFVAVGVSVDVCVGGGVFVAVGCGVVVAIGAVRVAVGLDAAAAGRPIRPRPTLIPKTTKVINTATAPMAAAHCQRKVGQTGSATGACSA